MPAQSPVELDELGLVVSIIQAQHRDDMPVAFKGFETIVSNCFGRRFPSCILLGFWVGEKFQFRLCAFESFELVL